MISRGHAVHTGGQHGRPTSVGAWARMWQRCCSDPEEMRVNPFRIFGILGFLTVCAVLIGAPSASAQALNAGASRLFARATSNSWHIAGPSCGNEAAPAARSLSLGDAPALRFQDDAQPLHAAAVEHSDAYETRKKIHKIASFATLPLFAVEVALGQSLFNNTNNSNSMRSAHAAVGASIMGLFAVNTVTGAWNMFGEDRRDPKGRTLRLVHGLLMMAADVGFVATSMSGPNSRGRNAATFATNEVTHRNLAIASFSAGTVGYLLMLFGNH